MCVSLYNKRTSAAQPHWIWCWNSSHRRLSGGGTRNVSMLEQAAESPSRHGIPAFQHDLMRLFSIKKSSQHDGPSTSAPLAPHTSEPGESKTWNLPFFSFFHIVLPFCTSSLGSVGRSVSITTGRHFGNSTAWDWRASLSSAGVLEWLFRFRITNWVCGAATQMACAGEDKWPRDTDKYLSF